jgi:hypothetical protein
MTSGTNILLITLYFLSTNLDTASALLDSTNSWYVNMDRKMFNLVVLLDLKKTFDTIVHCILLRKL